MAEVRRPGSYLTRHFCERNYFLCSTAFPEVAPEPPPIKAPVVPKELLQIAEEPMLPRIKSGGGAT
jgi:hypothetical protein